MAALGAAARASYEVDPYETGTTFDSGCRRVFPDGYVVRDDIAKLLANGGATPQAIAL